MNLEQLVFTWKERQLVLALFASCIYISYNMLKGKINPNVAQNDRMTLDVTLNIICDS